MASPFDPEQYLPFADAGWSDLPEILQHGDFRGDPWDSDAEKPLAELAERESCTPPSQRPHSEPMLTPPPPAMASPPSFTPLCTPRISYQPTVNSPRQHTRPPVVVPLDPPTPAHHCAQDPISPRTEHLLTTVEPSTMRDLVDMGLMRYRFAVEHRGSLQLYLQGERVSWSHFIEPSLERALAIACAIDPNCRPARAPLRGKPARPDVALQFEATASQPTLGALLEGRWTSLLPMRSTTTPRTEKRAKPAPVRRHVAQKADVRTLTQMARGDLPPPKRPQAKPAAASGRLQGEPRFPMSFTLSSRPTKACGRKYTCGSLSDGR